MGIGLRVRLDGLDELLRQLAAADDAITNKAVRAGVNDASKAMLRAAKANLRAHRSVDTGALLKSLGRVVRTYGGGRVSVAVVGVRKDAEPRAGRPKVEKYGGDRVRRGRATPTRVVPANYVHLVEFGTRPHALAKGARLARDSGRRASAGRLQGAGPQHPGARPRPFLRPAADDTLAYAADAVRRRVRDAVAKRSLAGRR